MQQRRQFTEEFKSEAVTLASQHGISTVAIARERGINANLLSRWKRELNGVVGQPASGSATAVSAAEFERMKRELATVRMERDILKALGFFAADPSLRTPLSLGIVTSGQPGQCVVLSGSLPAIFTTGWIGRRAPERRLMADC